MELFLITETTILTMLDILQVAAILLFFNSRSSGSARPILVGLALFLVGLEEALSLLGDIMAKQITNPTFVGGGKSAAALT